MTPTRRRILDATAAYTIIVPTTPEWLRMGLNVRLAFPLGRVPLALAVDASFTTAPALSVDASNVTARVWPVGLGLAYTLHRPRWHFAVGPRASLQIVTADARTPSGRVGGATTFSAGVGAHVEAAWMFWRWLGLIAAVDAEALVPRQQFAAGPGPGMTDLGWAQFSFNAGILASVP